MNGDVRVALRSKEEEGGGKKDNEADTCRGLCNSDLQLALEAAPKIDREENRSKGTLRAVPMPHECLITWRELR